MSAAFSTIMVVGALVPPATISGEEPRIGDCGAMGAAGEIG
jgi:hypothetical protein